MHEVTVAQGIIDVVVERCRASGFAKVHAVHVTIGVLSSVMPDALRFSFDAVARGTPVEGAALVIREVAAEAHCEDCEAYFAARSRVATCPRCKGVRCVVRGGDELRVSALEVD